MRRHPAFVSVAIVLMLLTLALVRAAPEGQGFGTYLPLAMQEGMAPTPTLTTLPSVTPTRTPTVTPSATPTTVPATLFPNGNFEQGATVWVQTFGAQPVIIQNPSVPVTPHSGRYLARLPVGDQDVEYDALIESPTNSYIPVPADKPFLVYWTWIRSDETTCGQDLGSVNVKVGSVTFRDRYYLCTATQTNGWVRHSLDLNSYIEYGVSVTLVSGATSRDSELSTFYVDDIDFSASP